ncbi:MAG: gamma-glutamyltransferase family protein [Betaproteobacteria bacterium]
MPQSPSPPQFTTRPEIRGTFGVVASTHWLASQTAMGILERGGNAFDAAVAGGFVLQVVEPHLNGPGGEVPLLIWSEKERRVRALCGQGSAPALATPQALRALGFGLVPGIGVLPAVVPGAFGAWMTLLREYGTMTLAEVLTPAIDYADHGFPVVARISQAILAVRSLFHSEWHSSRDIWLPGGNVPRPGELFCNKPLAATYKRILRETSTAAESGAGRIDQIDAAVDLWYKGFVAREIDRFYREEQVMDCSGERHRGLLRHEDMARWQPAWEDPVTLDFGDTTVAKCGPWSQGPVFLQQLAMLKHASLESCDPCGSAFVHRVAEATKLAMADRLAWYGDPAYVDVPLSHLLSDEYARERWALVGDRASTLLRPGRPGGRAPVLPDPDIGARELARSDARFGAGEPTFAELPPMRDWAEQEVFVGDTVHIDVIDRFGNMVSATPSGGWLSSSPAIPALGFCVTTRLQTTWLDDGTAAQLAPGKRPTTTLSPSMALRNGEPFLAFGTPGGDQQDQWTVSFFLRHVLFGMNLQEAIDAPAWHVDHFPGSFWPRLTTLNRLSLESRFEQSVKDELAAAGHTLRVGLPWSEGRISVCSQRQDARGRRLLLAAANPRGMQGYAVGR